MWQYNHSDTLYHHGIKGQRWGVRRYQNEDGTLTSAGKKRYNDVQESTNEESTEKSKFHLSDNQKKAIKIGAAVVTTALITYGAYKITKNGKLNLSKISDVAGNMIDSKTGLELQSRKESVSETVKAVNPKFSIFNKNYYMNCGNCAVAFEARSRGFNVEANGNPNGMTIAHMGQFFKGFHSDSFKEIDIDTTKLSSDIKQKGKQVEQIMKDTISSQCSNSDGRGALFFPADFGSHWVSWVKENGKVTFFNSQDHSVNLTEQVFGHYRYHRNNASAALTSVRLDDLEINSDQIHSVIQNVTKKARTKAQKFDTWVAIGENFVTDWT